MSGEYWKLVEPVWNQIDIYEVDRFLTTYHGAPIRSAMLYAAHFCQSEICNGGFRQFFSNSTGVLAPEAVEGFHAIGQDATAAVVHSAMNEFGFPYPRDRALRNLQLSRFASNKFELFDERFYAEINTERGGFETAADNFAAQ